MKRLQNWMLAAALGALLPSGVHAAVDGRAFRYTRSVWRVSDGLPEDTVQALAESREGVLWIGTTGGLASFDGTHVQMLEGGKTQLSQVNSIFSLTLGRDGSLWAGTEGGGVLRINGVHLKAFGAAEGLSDGFVRSVLEDSRGRIWAGTDGGLFVKDGEWFRRWDDSVGSGQKTLSVHSVIEDAHGRVWAGGSRLVSIDADGQATEYALPGNYSQNRVKKILQTADGTIWVGTVGGLERLRNGKFESVSGIHATVRTLLQTRDGTLWIGTIGSGLWTLRDESLTRVSAPQLLPSDTVLSIFEDDQSQVWVGTQAGLARLNTTPVALVPLPEGGDPDFETISGDLKGDLWVAAQKLYAIHDGVARGVSLGEVGSAAVRNVFRARDGALWIGTDGSGVYRVREGGETAHYSAAKDLTNNFVRGFMETRDGTMWIACDEGVNLISAHGNRKLTEADGLAYFSTRSLWEDNDGGVWIGTDRGLSHWKDGRFVKDTATLALANEKVWSLLQDRAGAMWFGTRDHGLFRYRDGTIRHYTAADGLPSNSVYQILQDRSGTFWLTGPNTIASAPGSEMDGDRAGPEQPISLTVYRMPFGADGAQLYGGRQPSGYLAPDDTVWFPTNRGVAHVTAMTAPVGPGPRAFLESVNEDGGTLSANGAIQIPARVNRVSFNFSAYFLRPDDGLRFRYRLEGFDKNWSLATSSRSATYTNLPAGRYEFRVEAFDTSRPRDLSEVRLSVRKRPFFYQTWWFFALCGVAAAVIAWSVYQARLRRVKQRFAAVSEERSRLAREMHDTVIQGCTGISALLEAVAVTPEPAAREELLGYARRQARSTVSEARQVVWDMRHEHEGDVEMVGALDGVVAQARRDTRTMVQMSANVESLRMRASAAHEVLMTVREAVNNALQHSGSQLVVLSLKTDGDVVEVSVSDEGRGFETQSDDAAAEGHYGILGMRERAERVGGTLYLTSRVGKGTTVCLRAPQAGRKERSRMEHG